MRKEISKDIVADSDEFILICIKNKVSSEIYYLNEMTSITGYIFSNNIDEAFCCRGYNIKHLIDKNMIRELLKRWSNVVDTYTEDDLLFICTDMYQVVKYEENTNNMKDRKSHHTLNLAEMDLYIKRKTSNDFIIEKYFPKTDEWYNIETGMTRDEELISKDLVSVVNRFNKLPCHHPRHQPDMADAVHVIQRLLQSRTCHRLFPDEWILYDKDGNKR